MSRLSFDIIHNLSREDGCLSVGSRLALLCATGLLTLCFLVDNGWAVREESLSQEGNMDSPLFTPTGGGITTFCVSRVYPDILTIPNV